jgi:hypothetical protein
VRHARFSSETSDQVDQNVPGFGLRAEQTDFSLPQGVQPAVRLGYACQSNAHARAVAADGPDVASVAWWIGAVVSVITESRL